MPTLRSLRYMSPKAAQLVEDELRQSLCNLLTPFITHPEGFLNVLQDSGAIIGPDVALPFIIRDLPIFPTTLTIYAPLDNPYPLQDYLEAQENIKGVKRELPTLENARIWRSQLIKALFTYDLDNSTTIYLYESCSPFPLASLASRAIGSHLVSFVDKETYGTPFPTLLFQHRALLGSPMFNQAIATSSEISKRYMDKHHFKPELLDPQLGANVWYHYHLFLNHTLESQQYHQDQ